MKQKIIYWLRRDFRLFDNPALVASAKRGQVIPVFILSERQQESPKKITFDKEEPILGGASRVWLHYTLKAFNDQIKGKLNLYMGNPEELLPVLAEQRGADGVYWNILFEPWALDLDQKLHQILTKDGIEAKRFNGQLLWTPESISKADGTYYRVFTPFYRKGCLNGPLPREPLPAPRKPDFIKDKSPLVLSLDHLDLLPSLPWGEQMIASWDVGEKGAEKSLKRFLQSSLDDYDQGRDFPAAKKVSRMSPHLHWGEISPNQLWYAVSSQGDNKNIDRYRSELAWREFAYHLICHFPEFPTKNFQSKFDAFPWLSDVKARHAWEQGKTGFPMIDAGMRELWQTGYMHNRVRMLVGSFLVKNMLLPWQTGEAWFWDCLLDADLAVNAASWQWVAGSGVDAAPYFRIFNPTTQATKFDPEGIYIRQYCPELAKLPNKYLFEPWTAPSDILQKAGIVLGKDYPAPILDLSDTRQRALEAFRNLPSGN